MNNINSYKILNSPDDNFKAIIISLTSESLSDNFDDIKSELLSNDIKGKILFDYLLSNGNNNNRFFEMDFNGEFLLNTFNKTTVSEEIKDNLLNFYSANYRQYIANSLLSEPLKYIFRRNARQV